jgi:hypothetical protein
MIPAPTKGNSRIKQKPVRVRVIKQTVLIPPPKTSGSF